MAVDRRAGHHLLGGRLRAVLGTLQDRLALVAWMKRQRKAVGKRGASPSKMLVYGMILKTISWDKPWILMIYCWLK